MMNLLGEPNDIMKGTKIYADGRVFVFVGLKKDANIEERLNYNDKFISKEIFQWESEHGVTMDSNIGKKLIESKEVYLFVRKIEKEDGIQLPFTYLGTGKFVNPRVSNNPGKSLLFDLQLDKAIPEYLAYDFKVPEKGE